MIKVTDKENGEKTYHKESTEATKVKINNVEIKTSFPVIKISGRINHIQIGALIDSGAACSVIFWEDAKKAKLEIKNSEVKLRTANNTLLKTGGYMTKRRKYFKYNSTMRKR